MTSVAWLDRDPPGAEKYAPGMKAPTLADKKGVVNVDGVKELPRFDGSVCKKPKAGGCLAPLAGH